MYLINNVFRKDDVMIKPQWRRFLLQKLIVKKFPAFYVTRKFITVLIFLQLKTTKFTNSGRMCGAILPCHQ